MITNRDCFFNKKSDFINRLSELSPDSICYIADTKEIYLKGIYLQCRVTEDKVKEIIESYGYLPIKDIPNLVVINNPESGDYVSGITVNGHEITVNKGNLADATTYQPDSFLTSTNAETTVTLGDLKAGYTANELKGKTFSWIFDTILFPVINPTFTNPSASIKFNGYTGGLKIAGVAAATESQLSGSFSRGAITLSGTRQNYRSGEETSESYYYSSPSRFPTTVPLGTISYYYRAYYEQGPQPYDNKGNPYSTPLAAGYVTSSAITVSGTLPYYASTSTSGTLTQQSLKSWATSISTGTLVFPPHTAANPTMIKIPGYITAMKMLNTVSNQWETISFNDWSYTENSETFNSIITHNYRTYTYNGADRGEVQLQITFNTNI